MKLYTITYELTSHYRHEVQADSLEEARLLFESDKSELVDVQQSSYATEIEEVE